MSAAPIMIVAGGTGGHVFPGLAVAETLRSRQRPVVWLGTRVGLEARVVPAAGIDVQWISIAGIRGRGALAWLVAPFRIVLAVAQSLRALYRCRPAAVLGMGGFVAGPGGIAAWLARKPLLIHEQNAVAGTTNRWLARLATRVFEGFPGSFAVPMRVETIGNPVRASIAALPERAPRARHGETPRLLVLGGSQGARALNRVVPEAIARLEPGQRPRVRHQAGRDPEPAAAAYADWQVAADIVGFIDDMAEAYAWADIVVARAGALTIAELAAAGVGGILVPYPYAIDGHQTRNAEHFVAGGAGLLLPEAELTAERLANELMACLASRERLEAMGRAARAQARTDAAAVLAQACLSVAEART